MGDFLVTSNNTLKYSVWNVSSFNREIRGEVYEGQSNENQTPATKWQWNLFYLKVIARSVNTFIPLGDETINSSLVERGESLMDPQPHPLLHFLVRMKPTSTNVFLQVAKNVEVTIRKIGTSFPGEVFSGFFLTCETNVRKLQAPTVPEYYLAIVIIHNHSLRAPMTWAVDAP